MLKATVAFPPPKKHNFSDNFRRLLDSLNKYILEFLNSYDPIDLKGVHQDKKKKNPKHIGVASPTTLKVSFPSSCQAPQTT